jgi:ABC-type Zn uptake system ZnuABC Zn-binding protein ZnuA/copper(I)-binding protein
MMRRNLSVILALWLMLVIAPLSVGAQDGEPLEVVASTTIIADVASQVGSDLVNVTSLVPFGGDVHNFQPVPADVARIVEADVVLVNGAGLEEWLEGIIEENSEVEPVVVSMGVPVLAFGGDTHDDHDHMDGDHMDDDHMDGDHMDDDHMDDDHMDDDHEEGGMGGMHGGMGMMGTVSAAYMEITNNGDSDITLNSASAPFSNLVEIHETSIVDDVAQMREVGQITIPAGETVVLQPGGLHIMLMQITEDLLLDDTASITIGFDNGATTELVVPITDIPPEEPQTLELGDLTIVGFWARPAAAMEMPMDGEMGDGMDDMHDDDHMDGHYIGKLGEVDCAMPMVGEHDDDEHSDAMNEMHDDHNHGACDPHFWTDPTNVMIWADNIAEAFASADPDNAEVYSANAEAYKAELMGMDMQIMERVESIPAENRVIITNHEFLGYFAERYGFDVVGTVLPGGSTLAETSPQELADLVMTIQKTGVSAIFAETSSPGDVATALAQEVGDSVNVVTLYSGALDENVPTYLDYLQFNLDAIVGALGE